MKKFFLFTALLCGFAACSDDSGENVGPNRPDDAGLLLGTWRVVRLTETEYHNGKKAYSHSDNEERSEIKATFLDDGTYFWTEADFENTPSPYTYDSEAHILRLTQNPGSGYYGSEDCDLHVTWLSTGRLTFRFEESGDDDGVAWRNVRELSFRRDK